MRQEEATAMLRGGKEGVTRWNELRLAGDEIPDLSGADLSQSEPSD